MGENIQDLPVKTVVLNQLGIWGGPHDKVLAAYVDKDLYDRQYTTIVVVRYALQSIHFRLVNDSFETGFIYILCPKMLIRLNNTSWRWIAERIIFRHVKHLT